MDTLRSAELKGYVTAAELAPIRALARRAFPALSNLMAYLRRTARTPPRTGRRPPRTDHNPPRTGRKE